RGGSPTGTDLVEVTLREPSVTTHRWDDDRLGAVRDQLRLSIRAMKAYLADPDANVARIDGFERTEELRICRWCNFRAVCRPEIGSEGGGGPPPAVGAREGSRLPASPPGRGAPAQTAPRGALESEQRS